MELQQYGDDDTQTEQQQRALVLNAISRFCQNFADYMQGNCRHKDQSILYGPARLRHIFTVEFRQNVNALDSRDALSDEDIHTVTFHAPLLVLDVVHLQDAQLRTYDNVIMCKMRNSVHTIMCKMRNSVHTKPSTCNLKPQLGLNAAGVKAH